MDSEKALQQAVNAIKAGDTETGQQLLAQVISADPQNEAAWLWMASTVDDPQEKRECLQRALRINPSNKLARSGLECLTPSDSPVEVPSLHEISGSMTRPVRNDSRRKGSQPKPQHTRSRGWCPGRQLVLVGGLVSLVGLFLPWGVMTIGNTSFYDGSFDYVVDSPQLGILALVWLLLLFVSPLVFLIGSIQHRGKPGQSYNIAATAAGLVGAMVIVYAAVTATGAGKPMAIGGYVSLSGMMLLIIGGLLQVPE